MLLFWSQALSLAILALNVRCIGAVKWSSIRSEIESATIAAVSSIESDASQFVGDVEKGFEVFEAVVEEELEKALDNSDGVLAQFLMVHQTNPPVSAQLITSGVQSNVTVGLYCANCTNATQPAAFNFASKTYDDWNNSWLGFALESFDALFEVNVDLSPTANGELTLSLLKIPAAADGVVVEVEFQLYLVADASASMSFTAGLNLSLSSPIAIMIPALDPVVQLNQSQGIGFDQQSFDLQTIFNASVPQLDFSMQFSLRTVLSITVEDINIGSLFLDLPAFSLTVNTLTNALSNCQPPPAGTPSDQIYAELIHLNGALVANLSYELLNGVESNYIDSWTIREALDECYAFFPGSGVIGGVPDSSKSPLLTAPPIITCMTGAPGGNATHTGAAAVNAALKSLSPGAKAGVVIGTLVGVAFITALAWFGGRASAKDNINHSRNGSVWVIPRPRSGKFFSRGSRRGEIEFSPVTSNTPAWQTTAYQGVSLNTEMQPQLEQQGWQMVKKEPFVTVNDAVTPSPTYISIGDDYGMPMPGAGNMEARYDAGSQSARYGEIRAGQAEGLSLLQASNGKPVVKRKEVSRKAVPQHGNGMDSL